MITAIYLKIQASRNKIDLPKDSIRCEEAYIKIKGQIQPKFGWPTKVLVEYPFTIQIDSIIRFRLRFRVNTF